MKKPDLVEKIFRKWAYEKIKSDLSKAGKNINEIEDAEVERLVNEELLIIRAELAKENLFSLKKPDIVKRIFEKWERKLREKALSNVKSKLADHDKTISDVSEDELEHLLATELQSMKNGFVKKGLQALVLFLITGSFSF